MMHISQLGSPSSSYVLLIRSMNLDPTRAASYEQYPKEDRKIGRKKESKQAFLFRIPKDMDGIARCRHTAVQMMPLGGKADIASAVNLESIQTLWRLTAHHLFLETSSKRDAPGVWK